MMKRRFTQEDKERILAQESTGKPVAEICRKNGITRTMFDEWKAGKKVPRLEGLTAAERQFQPTNDS